MRKNHFCLLVFLFVSIYSYTQDIEAPVNPEFLIWKQKISNAENHSGDIPYYVLPNFNGLSAKGKALKSFDQVYDLRNEGFVTPVKNQGSCGVCWTFAAAGTVESFMLKNGMGSLDFSEQNIRTCHGFELDSNLSCSGGNPKMAAAYLTRMEGPVDESSDPYNTDMYEICSAGLPVIYQADQFRLFNDSMDVVKQAILDYGALYTNMYNDAVYYNSTNYTYYYGGTASTDHAILLCGWDDNKVTAGGTGAWIIKNSWGTGWGENGYFYISYNDSKVLTTVGAFPGISQIEAGDRIYMYDELGWISNVGYSAETGLGLVKFVSVSNEQLNSVGTYVNSEAATVSIEIYDTKSGNTLSGLLASLGPFNCDYPGYYKFDLTSPVLLSTGQDFYVKAEYHTPGYLYPIPYEKYSADYANPVIEAGVCWMSSNGSSWTQLGNDVSGKERDLCIRAYTGDISSSDNILTDNKNLVKIYPSPASDFINVSFDQKINNFSIQILNLDSKLLISKNSDDSEICRLDVKNLSPGLYLIKLFDGSGSLVNTYKWVKE